MDLGAFWIKNWSDFDQNWSKVYYITCKFRTEAFKWLEDSLRMVAKWSSDDPESGYMDPDGSKMLPGRAERSPTKVQGCPQDDPV